MLPSCVSQKVPGERGFVVPVGLDGGRVLRSMIGSSVGMMLLKTTGTKESRGAGTVEVTAHAKILNTAVRRAA